MYKPEITEQVTLFNVVVICDRIFSFFRISSGFLVFAWHLLDFQSLRIYRGRMEDEVEFLRVGPQKI